MGGFIVLEDGRAFAVANWAWRQAIQKIGEALATIPGRTAFAQWFAMIVELPAGLNELDLRELTPGNRAAFHEATRIAIRLAESTGSRGWPEPEFFEGWLGET